MARGGGRGGVAPGAVDYSMAVVLVGIVLSLAAATQVASAAGHDYRQALSKSILYFEAQRSGRLPHGQRVAWRDHSGLTDGLEQGVRCYCCCVDCFVRASAGDEQRD